jgi:hypothetical protein
VSSRSARWVAGAVVFAAAVFLLTLRTSRLGRSECCGPLPNTCEALKDADLVFLGDVLGTHVRPRTQDGNVAEDAVNVVSFQVLGVFQGNVTNAGGEWSGEFHERSPAHHFIKGQRVVVYARRSHRTLFETTCARTREFNS